MDDGPPEEKSRPPELYKVMEYPAYSGPPERDKVMNSGPPEENFSSPDQNKVTKYSRMLEMYSQGTPRGKTWLSKMGQNNKDGCLIIVEPFSHVLLHWLYKYCNFFNSTLVLGFFSICES